MSTIRRVLGAAAAVAAVTALSTPAAAEPPAQLSFTLHDMGVSPAGKWTSLRLSAAGTESPLLDDVRLVIDTAGAAELVTAWVPQFLPDDKVVPSKDCTVAGTVTTCSLGRRGGASGYLLPYLVVQAKDGAAVGQSGKISVSISAKGLAPIVTTPTITVADDVDIAAGPAGFKTSGDLGKRVPATIEVTNTGTKPVQGVVARFVAMQGLEMTGRYTNCEYAKRNDVAYCRFDTELAPGATYSVGESPFALKADAKAAKSPTYLHQWLTRDDADEQGSLSALAGEPLTPGTSGVLTLVRKPATAGLRAKTTDSKSRNNIAWGFVTPNASAPATPSASPTAPAGGTLPVTGADAGTVAAIGGGFLALGLGFYLFGRRRRTSTTA